MAWYVDVGIYLWGLFSHWLNTIFIVPFKTADMLWLLVPVWLAWFFAEFFQEKTGTSLGNAVSNAVIILWGSIDCSRQTIGLISEGALNGFLPIFLRFMLIFLIFGYGVIIVILGWKGNKLIKYIGRIREITYVFAVFVPVFYGAIELTWNHIIASVLFFPLFYFAIELIDRYTPNPKTIANDLKDSSEENNGFGSSGKNAFRINNTSSNSQSNPPAPASRPYIPPNPQSGYKPPNNGSGQFNFR